MSKDIEGYEWENELAYIPIPEIPITIPKPILPPIQAMVYIAVPEEPVTMVEVSIWEKIWFIYTKYKSYLDILIKLTPIIMPLLTIIGWLKSLKKERF